MINLIKKFDFILPKRSNQPAETHCESKYTRRKSEDGNTLITESQCKEKISLAEKQDSILFPSKVLRFYGYTPTPACLWKSFHLQMKPTSQPFDPNRFNNSRRCDGAVWGASFQKVQRGPPADLFLVTVTAGIMSEGARGELAGGWQRARWGNEIAVRRWRLNSVFNAWRVGRGSDGGEKMKVKSWRPCQTTSMRCINMPESAPLDSVRPLCNLTLFWSPSQHAWAFSKAQLLAGSWTEMFLLSGSKQRKSICHKMENIHSNSNPTCCYDLNIFIHSGASPMKRALNKSSASKLKINNFTKLPGGIDGQTAWRPRLCACRKQTQC